MRMRLPVRFLLWAILILGFACSLPVAGQAQVETSRAKVFARVHALTLLGKKLFNEQALSGSGKMACASCHVPASAYGPPNDLPVQMGGADLKTPGFRAVPSLTYTQAVPPFTEHFFESEDDGDESVDNGPTGGLTWDGRVDRGSAQAAIPLLSPFEMANPDEGTVVEHALKAGYGPRLTALGGKDPRKAFTLITEALEDYEQDSATFYPYSSKYDAYLAGRATLTAQEAHGLDLFNDPTKGDCARCHISQPAPNGTPPQFTDYGLIALGLPLNPAIPANADPAWHDLGLCGPFRTDLTDHPDYCGLFRTPSLRNVALRRTFFHNGAAHTLEDAIRFYVERDTRPEKWYPKKADGTVDKYDDLPAQYRTNIETDTPFGGKPGDPPPLSESEIEDVAAFLKTLTDGYTPPSTAAK